MKKLTRLSLAVLALIAIGALSSCGTTAGNTKTIKHHPHQHNVSR